MYADKKLNMLDYYLLAFKKYAQFSGRSTRSEFWYFYLLNFIISSAFVLVKLLAFLVDDLVFGKAFLFYYFVLILSTLYSLGVVIPHLAVSWRRLHDTNHSGLWSLSWISPFVLLVICLALLTITDENSSSFILYSFGMILSAISMLIISIYLILLYCKKSDLKTNRFGDAPEAFQAESIEKPATSLDNLEMLEKLASLKEKGVITEEEFQKKKSELL